MGEEYKVGSNAPVFCWLASRAMPTSLDLRQNGWQLIAFSPKMPCLARAVGLIDRETFVRDQWSADLNCLVEDRNRALIIIDANCGRERADLLRQGIGDAVASDISLDELDARARQIARARQNLPRLRRIGNLTLDLLAREAYQGERPLNLNPREFALIWRLAENPNQPVSKVELIHDVWRMGFVPETNSIAVHMSRLRRKLSVVGIKNLIDTVPSGGYALRTPEFRPQGAAVALGKRANEHVHLPRTSEASRRDMSSYAR